MGALSKSKKMVVLKSAKSVYLYTTNNNNIYHPLKTFRLYTGVARSFSDA